MSDTTRAPRAARTKTQSARTKAEADKNADKAINTRARKRAKPRNPVQSLPSEASARAKYEQVADQLRDLITTGQLPPAALLPSESQLMDRYGVSRVTARAAIAALRTQGLVTVVKGKGAFVRRSGDRPTHTFARTISTRGDGEGAGYSDDDTDDAAARDADGWWEAEAPTTYRVNATPALALAAGVAEHTPLFGCDRLLENAAGRRMLHRLYIPFATVAAVPALEEDPFVRSGRLYSLLSEAGYALAWTEYVTARNPNPDDAATLRVPNGTPVIATRRITHHAGHPNAQPLAMEETHRSADDAQLAYDITPRPRSVAE